MWTQPGGDGVGERHPPATAAECRVRGEGDDDAAEGVRESLGGGPVPARGGVVDQYPATADAVEDGEVRAVDEHHRGCGQGAQRRGVDRIVALAQGHPAAGAGQPVPGCAADQRCSRRPVAGHPTCLADLVQAHPPAEAGEDRGQAGRRAVLLLHLWDERTASPRVAQAQVWTQTVPAGGPTAARSWVR